MKTSITIVVPDAVFAYFEDEARRRGIGLPTVCANWIVDHWINDHVSVPQKRQRGNTGDSPPAVLSRPEGIGTSQTTDRERTPYTFNVARAFPDYPRQSQEYAQSVVDEVLKLPGVSAQTYNDGRGIIFEPNFISIEYLRKRKPGIHLSLGSPRGKLKNPPAVMKRGRTDSYSRILIDCEQLLQQSLPLVRQTYEVCYPT